MQCSPQGLRFPHPSDIPGCAMSDPSHLSPDCDGASHDQQVVALRIRAKVNCPTIAARLRYIVEVGGLRSQERERDNITSAIIFQSANGSLWRILICVESERWESQGGAQGPIYVGIDSLTQTLAVKHCSRLASSSFRVPWTTLRASSKALEARKLRSHTWVMSKTVDPSSPTPRTSSRTQPKTADNWRRTLQATSHSWAHTSVENNTWHFGFVILSDLVDYSGMHH